MKKEYQKEDPMVKTAMDLFEDEEIVETSEEEPQKEYQEEPFVQEQPAAEVGTLLNAQIDNADIVLTEGGFVSIYLSFKWDGYGQGIAMYNLEGEYLAKWVHTILDVLEIDNWKDVKGKYCRIIRSEPGWNGNIIGMKNIINDKTFLIKND